MEGTDLHALCFLYLQNGANVCPAFFMGCYENLLRPICFPDYSVHQDHLGLVTYTHFQTFLPRDAYSLGLRWGLRIRIPKYSQVIFMI